MSLAVILQFAGLVVTLIVGAIIVYAIFEMREVYSEQRENFLRAISAVEIMQHLQPELIALVEKAHTDSHKFQEIGQQIQKSIVDLNFGINYAVQLSADKRTAAIDDLRRHMNAQENHLRDAFTQSMEYVSDATRAALTSSAERHSTALEDLRNHVDIQESRLAEMVQLLNQIAEGFAAIDKLRLNQLAQQADAARLRKDVLANDALLRFNLLKDWIRTNSPAILRRASTSWNSPRDLISVVPESLQAEAEVLDGTVLLIGTRGQAEHVALPIKHIDETSQYTKWFEIGSSDVGIKSQDPAIVIRSSGNYELVRKGTAPGA